MKIEDITLDWLMARVREDEYGCWVWVGATKKDSDLAVARIGDNMRPVRLVLLEIIREKQLQKGSESGCTCGNNRCVHPEHIVSKRINQNLKGRTLSITHKVSIAETKRSVSSISQDTVRQLRYDDASPKEWAEKLGIHESYVNQIRSNKVRRDYSSPFAGLGA